MLLLLLPSSSSYNACASKNNASSLKSRAVNNTIAARVVAKPADVLKTEASLVERAISSKHVI